MEYSVGQILVHKEDTELEGCFGTKKPIKAGTKMFIGADKLGHYLNGCVRPISSDDTVGGYSVNGLSEWIYIWLKNAFPMEEFFDGYDITKEEFKEGISDALEELGMYDNTGNRS